MALHGDPEVIRVFKMLDPKPKALVSPGRRLLREGEVLQYNTKERRPKLKYFFLFTDVLLITKREGPKKFWLKVYITLQPSLKIADVPDSAYRVPNVEFRLFAPRRTFIFFCKNQQSKEDWIRSIQACIDGKPSQAGAGHAPAAAGLRYDPSTGHRHSPQQSHPRPGGSSAAAAAAGRPVAQEPNYEELYFAEKARQVMDTPDLERTQPESQLLRLAAGMDDMSVSSSRAGKKVAIVGADGPSDGDDDADFGSLRVDNSQPAPAFDLLWGDAAAPASAPVSSSPGAAAAPAFDLFGGTPSAPAGQYQFPGAAPVAAPAGQYQFPGASPVAGVPAGQFQFPGAAVPAPGQYQFPGAAPVAGVPAPGQFQFPGAAAPGQFQFPAGAAVPGQYQFPGAAPVPGQFQYPGAVAPGQYQFPGAAGGAVPAGMPGQYQFPQATAAPMPTFGVPPAAGGLTMAPSKPRTPATEAAAKDPFADLVSLKL